MKSLPLAIALTLASLAAGAAHAQHDAHHPAASSAANRASGTPAADGEVRRIDKDAGKITLRHGPIANLDMPPMTMVFQVSDRTLLDKVKVGDKVKFAAEEKAGAYIVTAIEAAQ